MSFYLGTRGFTIKKSALKDGEETTIKEELWVKADMPKTAMEAPATFPIYRESTDKLYIPRFYGYTRYGIKNRADIKSVIGQGQPIDVPFSGGLHDYQENIIGKYMKVANDIGGGLLEVGCGRGKTVMALNIISRIGRKTLVIVHKEFLLNQWVERINQFLPTARVGRIQAQVIDTDDKDIVIGMLQSISMKEYPQELFAQFGLTIFDECHHIGAEVFSRSLFKIVSCYMLGLSATMTRKDGLTKVFKWFIGDVFHSETQQKEENVLVRKMIFRSDDEEFGEVKLNYRGQVHYSIMIKKLCEYEHRSLFILAILDRLLKEFAHRHQQIMILAHNKSLLKYLYDTIAHRNMATVGYYIGGMKEADLKASETKQVIIATYAMAEEALDIKTLTTLILATPKTDVTQAVGRILRVSHSQPVVVDIVDEHDIFQQQWYKRYRFYKKNKYTIVETDNHKFYRHVGHGCGVSEPAKVADEEEKPSKLVNTGKCLVKLNLKLKPTAA